MRLFDLDDKDGTELSLEIFDLNELQRQIFREIRDEKLTVKEVADRVDRSRSTTQRALKKMLDQDLIMREARKDKTIYYVYTTLPMSEIFKAASNMLEQWHEEAQRKLD